MSILCNGKTMLLVRITKQKLVQGFFNAKHILTCMVLTCMGHTDSQVQMYIHPIMQCSLKCICVNIQMHNNIIP